MGQYLGSQVATGLVPVDLLWAQLWSQSPLSQEHRRPTWGGDGALLVKLSSHGEATVRGAISQPEGISPFLPFPFKWNAVLSTSLWDVPTCIGTPPRDSSLTFLLPGYLLPSSHRFPFYSVVRSSLPAPESCSFLPSKSPTCVCQERLWPFQEKGNLTKLEGSEAVLDLP